VGLERDPLSCTEELLERKSSGSGLENQNYGHAYYTTPLYPQKVAQTSPTSGGRSVHIVRSRTQATEFGCFVCLTWIIDQKFWGYKVEEK
jgi:hypothetical protein